MQGEGQSLEYIRPGLDLLGKGGDVGLEVHRFGFTVSCDRKMLFPPFLELG